MKFTLKSVIFCCTLLLACTASAQTKLNPDAFEKMLKELGNQVQLIDVRTAEEFVLDRLEGAQNYNFRDSDFKDRLKALDKAKPILLYCAAGGRSIKTSELLIKYGFKDIYELEGGIHAWIEKEKPLAK
jgi:rhodanese-related sulfurtransferase